MLIGNVGRDPEVKYVDRDVPVARLSLATTERGYTLQNGTQVPDRTDWHTVILWRKLAKVVEEYVHKGDKLYVEGRLRYTSYNDRQGVKRTMAEIWAENMELLTPKSASAATAFPSAPQPEGQSAGQAKNARAEEARHDDPIF